MNLDSTPPRTAITLPTCTQAVLHQLGDTRRLLIPGRPRLDRDFGEVIHDIIA